MRRPLALLLLPALLSTPRPGLAQELALAAVHVDADHDLLGATTGFLASAGFDLSSRVGLRVGYERSGATFGTRGSTCHGLRAIEEDCAEEDRTDRARLRAGLVSAPVILKDAGRLRLTVVPGIQWASMVSEQRGERTDRVRRASKSIPGAHLGLEVSLEPIAGRPFAVVLSGSQSLLDPLRTEHVADGYTPFEERIGLRRVALGVVLRR